MDPLPLEGGGGGGGCGRGWRGGGEEGGGSLGNQVIVPPGLANQGGGEDRGGGCGVSGTSVPWSELGQERGGGGVGGSAEPETLPLGPPLTVLLLPRAPLMLPLAPP